MLLSFYYAVKLTQPKSPQTLPSSPQAKNRKRERSQDPENPHIRAPAKPLQKRVRISVADTIDQEAASADTKSEVNPTEYWIQNRSWPKEYFEQESDMSNVLARKKSSSSLWGKQSETGSAGPSFTATSDQKPREAKSAPYASPSYETVLATKGSFMDEFDEDIKKASSDFCQTLLRSKQTYPQDSLFRNDLFATTCRKIRNRNEAMVIRDISLLIVPSAQTLATYGATHLNYLIESVNEGWKRAMPFYGPRPQPDYSVGFGRSAFTADHLKKLKPFVGAVTDTFATYYMATWQMYFPFLTCEVKCGAAALDVADRQNAHSMTLAVRGVVELFRLVGREKELHREILAFSISHDDRTVRIYGHYPIINGKDTTYYRHPIHTFDFTALDGKEKWTAYKFTKNVYDKWMPSHFKRISSAIDELPPDLEFEVSELQGSGLSQVFENQSLPQQSNPDTTSLAENDDSQSSLAGSITPNTSLSHGTEQGAFKKPKRRRPGE
jgi:hypothetical protein